MAELLKPFRHLSKQYYLRVSRKEKKDLWSVIIGNWPENSDSLDLKTTEEIVMKKDDLSNFANEIRRVVGLKTQERVVLALSFKKNKPQFRFCLTYITPKDGQIDGSELSASFDVDIGFHNYYSAKKETREDLQYIYEDGGQHMGLVIRYPEDILLEFADELEKEANSA